MSVLKIDEAVFFAAIRQSVFRGRLSREQFKGCKALLAVWQRDYSHHPVGCLAYGMATAYHETAHTMQPIREYGRGRGRKYGRRVGPWHQVYYGRGYVQLTWLGNYRKAGHKLGHGDAFARHPDKVMEPEIAAQILFRGSIEGWFTGKKFSDYITDRRRSYRGARRIINGTDKAGLIAGYAEEFEDALAAAIKAAKFTPVRTPVPLPEQAETEEDEPAPKPVDPGVTGKPLPKSTTVWSAIGAAIVNTVSAIAAFGQSQPMLAAGLVFLGAAVAAWIIRERWIKSQTDGV